MNDIQFSTEVYDFFYCTNGNLSLRIFIAISQWIKANKTNNITICQSFLRSMENTQSNYQHARMKKPYKILFKQMKRTKKILDKYKELEETNENENENEIENENDISDDISDDQTLIENKKEHEQNETNITVTYDIIDEEEVDDIKAVKEEEKDFSVSTSLLAPLFHNVIIIMLLYLAREDYRKIV